MIPFPRWVPNKPLECLKVYGTSSLEHPAVQMVAMERGELASLFDRKDPEPAHGRACTGI